MVARRRAGLDDVAAGYGADVDRDLIAAALPPGAVYAGKTGQLSANRNDAALVRGPGRFYVLVVYTSLPDNDAGTDPGAKKIQAIAREVDAFLSR